MGRLGEWDKVERKKRPIKFTRSDELWEYTKMGVIIVMGLAYLWVLWF